MDEAFVLKLGELMLWVAVAVALLGVIGLLWAPVAAASCAFVARARKLPPGLYASSGAKYSILLILPWVYLLIKLFGRSLPFLLLATVYALIYVVWAVGLIGGQAVSIAYFVLNSYGDDPLPLGGSIFWGGLTLTAASVSTFTLIWTLRRVHQRAQRGREDSYSPPSPLLDARYLEPFGWLLGWALLEVILAFIVGVYSLSQM